MSSQPDTKTRSIPSLDGLRAFAVGAVILSHTNPLVQGKSGFFRYVTLALGQGGIGVNAFFVISGFLITTLLLTERERFGSINLRRFYFRRTMRIFPPYYVYLMIAALVGWWAQRPIPPAALITSATYTSDYWPYFWIVPYLPSWYTLHTWSLAVEEQFYLIWPFLLVRLSKRQAVGVCLAAVLLVPFGRVATVLYLPVYRGAEQWFRLFHTQADALSLGCLLAFVLRDQVWRAALQRYLHPAAVLGCCAFLVLCARLFTHEPVWFSALATLTTANLCLAYIIAFAVLRPSSIGGKFLNLAFLRHIGLISYSLYLWQQIFLGVYPAFHSWQWNVLCVFAAAELSFYLVERPSLRLRAAIEPKLRFLHSRDAATALSAVDTRSH